MLSPEVAIGACALELEVAWFSSKSVLKAPTYCDSSSIEVVTIVVIRDNITIIPKVDDVLVLLFIITVCKMIVIYKEKSKAGSDLIIFKVAIVFKDLQKLVSQSQQQQQKENTRKELFQRLQGKPF